MFAHNADYTLLINIDENFFQMYRIVEFQDKSVGIVHRSWITAPGKTYWPGVSSKKHKLMLTKGAEPPSQCLLYPIKELKSTGNFF